MKIIETLKFWIQNARYHALGQSFWACFATVCIAITYSNFNPKLAILSVIGVLLAHLSINLLDDYFDFKSGSVEKRNELENTVRSGKCTYLLSNQTTTKKLLLVSLFLGGVAGLIGLYLYFERGTAILIFAIIAALLGFFYSAPPLKLSYHGLGEIVVGLMFGPLLMNGVFYCAVGSFSEQCILTSIALGLLVINILYVHSLMDMTPDKAVGKNTLATILRTQFLQVTALIFFAIFPYWLIINGVLSFGMPKFILTTFLTLPLTCFLIKLMIDYLDGSTKEHKPKFWMGQMECWERITKVGIEWFMIRWYLARNIMIYFSALVCLAYALRLKGLG